MTKARFKRIVRCCISIERAVESYLESETSDPSGFLRKARPLWKERDRLGYNPRVARKVRRDATFRKETGYGKDS